MLLIPSSVQESAALSTLSELITRESGDLRTRTHVLSIMYIDRVAPSVLPYLAWQFSAEDYADDLPEDVQRAVVKNALRAHRFRGTVYAVRSSIAALGAEVELVEWFDQTPQGEPYTFRINITAQATGHDDALFLNAERLEQLRRAADRAKNVRSGFGFGVAVKASTGFGFSATARAAVHLRLKAVNP